MKFNERFREFELPDIAFKESIVINKLGPYAVRGKLPELYWNRVRYCLDKVTEQSGIRKAYEEFQRQLTYPYVPVDTVRFPGEIPNHTPTETVVKPYQMEAIRHMVNGSMLLGDDLGLGKTLCALWSWYSLYTLFKQKGKVFRLTVFTPSEEVADEWNIALRTHINKKARVRILDKDRSNLEECYGSTIVVVPYFRCWREGFREVLRYRAKQYPNAFVLDECHRLAYVTSTQHRFVAGLIKDNPSLRVWALSGTEVANTPETYCGVYRLVTRSSITVSDWKTYLTKAQSGNNAWVPKRLSQIGVMRKGFAMRRTVKDIQMELPPLTEVTLKCDMHPLQREIYMSLEQEARAELVTLGDKVKTLTGMHHWTVALRCAQFCSHPILLEESRIETTPKWDRLELLMEEAGERKTLIWSNFPKTIEWLAARLRDKFQDKRVEFAHGGIGKEERNRLKHAMQAGEVDILIANPAIWGEGVNLTEASINVYWDYHASRTRWEQSRKRSHRQGQKRPVIIYRLVHNASVEERCLRWLERKGKLAQLITGN